MSRKGQIFKARIANCTLTHTRGHYELHWVSKEIMIMIVGFELLARKVAQLLG